MVHRLISIYFRWDCIKNDCRASFTCNEKQELSSFVTVREHNCNQLEHKDVAKKVLINKMKNRCKQTIYQKPRDVFDEVSKKLVSPKFLKNYT